MSRRKFREDRSKFYGAKQVLKSINLPAHQVLHDLDPSFVQLPAGGLAGQFLMKDTNENYDVSWSFISAFPAVLDGGYAPPVAVDSIIDGNSANAAHDSTLDGGSS